ncbi:MAG: DNA repair protein RecO C-terminal domain-containing protein [Planctomycetota bacterium]|nr:DNA repair protein RecO C-terminal domain-containing protein [Planctomycetota bacterium]
MAILKDLAQVLRTFEQGNTSLVAVMLGRRLGQFRVHIKGGRRWPKKGFEGGFDLLTRGEMLVYPRSGDSLWLFKEWDEHARPDVGRSVAMLRAASYLCELTEALTRHTAGSLREEFPRRTHAAVAGVQRPTAALYAWLATTADALAAGAARGPLLLTFTTRALQIEGLMPELHVCAGCRCALPKPRQPRPHAVWLTAAGLCCPECAAKEAVDEPTKARGEWLSPEAHLVLIHMHKTARPVAASAGAARQLARALVVLVHGALEHDLRTLSSAARMVQAMRR